MNDDEVRGFLEIFSEEFRDLKDRVEKLEEQVAKLNHTTIPQLHNVDKDLKAESKKTQDKLTKFESETNVRLKALEKDAVDPQAAAKSALPAFRKIDTKKEMDAEFAKYDHDVLVEVAKLLEPSSKKDQAVVRLMIESSTENGKGDGVFTAEIVTLFGTKAHA